MITSQETRRLAYEAVQQRLGRNMEARAIYMLLQARGRLCDLQIQQETGFPCNIVTARRNDLVRAGLVVQDGTVRYGHPRPRLRAAWVALEEPRVPGQEHQRHLF